MSDFAPKKSVINLLGVTGLALTAVARTERFMRHQWRHDEGRKNKARAFLKRAKKSDARRRIEKKTRKRMRAA